MIFFISMFFIFTNSVPIRISSVLFASIKFCNAQIADDLLELATNQYNNFTEVLADVNKKTSVNSRQLTILIGLNYFEEFGKNQYLMQVSEIYDKFALCKIISKKKMESLG